MAKIYVASSWRNETQPEVVSVLRGYGNEVMPSYTKTSENQLAYMEDYILALDNPISEAGFKSDFDAMQWADAFLLVLPCGRSAHLELGWAVGAGKRTAIMLDPDENGMVTPELMYKMVDFLIPGWSILHRWAADWVNS